MSKGDARQSLVCARKNAIAGAALGATSGTIARVVQQFEQFSHGLLTPSRLHVGALFYRQRRCCGLLVE
jgi:hypothetical protein